MRSLIIPFVLLLTIIGGGLLEQFSLHSSFDEFQAQLDAVQIKIEQNQCSAEDIDKILDWWQKKKNIMHTYIPHTEIRDIDNWLVEMRTYLVQGETEHALAKLSVVQDISESIPNAFAITPGNIF